MQRMELDCTQELATFMYLYVCVQIRRPEGWFSSPNLCEKMACVSVAYLVLMTVWGDVWVNKHGRVMKRRGQKGGMFLLSGLYWEMGPWINLWPFLCSHARSSARLYTDTAVLWAKYSHNMLTTRRLHSVGCVWGQTEAEVRSQQLLFFTYHGIKQSSL